MPVGSTKSAGEQPAPLGNGGAPATGGEAGGAASSSQQPTMTRQKSNRFNPSAWAEQRKERIQKGEEIRQQNRTRLIATGQIGYQTTSGGGTTGTSSSSSSSSSIGPGAVSSSASAGVEHAQSYHGSGAANPYLPGNYTASSSSSSSYAANANHAQEHYHYTNHASSSSTSNIVGSPTPSNGGEPVFDRKYLNRYEHQNYRYARSAEADYDLEGAGAELTGNSGISTSPQPAPAAAHLPPPRKFNRAGGLDHVEDAPVQRSVASTTSYTLDSPPGVGHSGSHVQLEDVVARPTSSSSRRLEQRSRPSPPKNFPAYTIDEEPLPSTSAQLGTTTTAVDPATSLQRERDQDAETEQAWLGMLRGGNNTHQSEDPLVFGAPNPNPKPAVPAATATSGNKRRSEQTGGSSSSTGTVRRFGAKKPGAGASGGGGTGAASGGAAASNSTTNNNTPAVGVMPEHIKQKIKTRESLRKNREESINSDTEQVGATSSGGLEQESTMLFEGDHNGVTPSKETNPLDHSSATSSSQGTTNTSFPQRRSTRNNPKLKNSLSTSFNAAPHQLQRANTDQVNNSTTTTTSHASGTTTSSAAGGAAAAAATLTTHKHRIKASHSQSASHLSTSMIDQDFGSTGTFDPQNTSSGTINLQNPGSTRGKGPPPGGANDDDERSFRQMFDKNTLRTEKGGKLFQAVIDKVRQGGLPEIAPPPQDSLPPFKGSASVKVFVRKRPMFEKDIRSQDFDTVTVHPGHVDVHNCLYHADLKTQFVQHNSFHLDMCFDENATNEWVYREAAFHLVEHACKGNISTMFMLGQTGSGKTYTMTAIESRAAKHVFEHSSKAAIQFLEVRNNRVFDLLHETGEKEVKLREVASGKYVIQDAYELECSAATELRACMQIGHHRRRTESTDANDTSSRSHALCLIRLDNGGKLVLVDCAGTERRKDSMYHTRERQQEGAQINASLHALKECIRHKADTNLVPTHVYRASCLTKLLADAFQDNGQLCIFCTVSPCATDTEHSISTLRTGFALTGRPGIYTRILKQTELEKFVNPDPVKRAIPPQKWDVKHVQAWLQSICGPEASSLLPAGTTGHMLVRMPEQRFVQLLGCARKGRKLYDALREEISAAKNN
ncbi:unnamed protein product [Amoebophrya sp. A120]|nr:unnamed protein product [Amoebophrya sp. A120]|eukprot:GSA120T00022663001.1